MMSNDEVIASGAFFGRKDLTEYQVPDGVTAIGDDAFGFCENLRHIAIPDGVRSIGHRAFANCTSLKVMKLPASVSDIGDMAFAGCRSLEDITFPAMEFFHPDTVGGCHSIRHVAISGRYANDSEAIYTADGQELCLVLPKPNRDNVEIPEGVLRIGPKAFSLCDGLRALSLPSSIESIDEAAFDGCHWLEEIRVRPDGIFSSHCGILMSDGIAIHCPQAIKKSRIAIAQGVVAIGARAFLGCENVTEVLLPSSLERIGECAFAHSKNLKAVLDGDLISVGGKAFLGCVSLSDLPDVDAADSIGPYAFGECKGIEKARIPDGVLTIEEGVFVDCERLASVDFNDEVTSIGEQAFLGCKALKSVDLPARIQRIGYGAFAWSGLQAIAIPNGVEDVAPMAFGICKDLELASAPRRLSASIDSIFYGCDKLSSLTI